MFLFSDSSAFKPIIHKSNDIITNKLKKSFFSRITLSSSNENNEIDAIKSNSKGFGTVKKISEPEIEKDVGTKTYESQAKRGVPEYNIFLRPTNGTDNEWVPVGSMTIPRDTKVSKAVFEVEDELLKGSFKLYPKLKAFYDVRSDKVGIFEYGFCLKAFPDEPITVITREEQQQSTNFFTNWYAHTDKILSMLLLL